MMVNINFFRSQYINHRLIFYKYRYIIVPYETIKKQIDKLKYSK